MHCLLTQGVMRWKKKHILQWVNHRGGKNSARMSMDECMDFRQSALYFKLIRIFSLPGGPATTKNPLAALAGLPAGSGAPPVSSISAVGLAFKAALATRPRKDASASSLQQKTLEKDDKRNANWNDFTGRKFGRHAI